MRISDWSSDGCSSDLLEHAVADFQHRHVEGAATKVVDHDGAAALLVEAVGESGRGGLVEDAQHVEAGDLAGVLGGLALGVVEVGGQDRKSKRLNSSH